MTPVGKGNPIANEMQSQDGLIRNRIKGKGEKGLTGKGKGALVMMSDEIPMGLASRVFFEIG